MKLFNVLLITITIINSAENQTLIQDANGFNIGKVVHLMNKMRLYVAKSLSVQEMNRLTWDESLVPLARRDMETCETESKDKTFGTVRFKLAEIDDSYHFDIIYANDEIHLFTRYLRKHGPEIGQISEQFPYYPMYQTERTRVGCALKVCTYGPPNYKLFNMLCYFGPEKNDSTDLFKKDAPWDVKRKIHPEPVLPFSDIHFRKDFVKFQNALRRGFAKRGQYGNMYEMVWDEALAKEAAKYAEECSHNRPQSFRSDLYSERFFYPELIPLLPEVQGMDIAESFLRRIGDTQRNRILALDESVPFWWNHTKIGCARRGCNHKAILCTFEKENKYENASVALSELFKVGPLCSLCSKCNNGSKCEMNDVRRTPEENNWKKMKQVEVLLLGDDTEYQFGMLFV
ncbi:unnamed protein product [Caenorhabditis sp. 36 PRJEB53466]|nr:unnamed protein product [Caenorhabditis sp. 36 PRJEB53466]